MSLLFACAAAGLIALQLRERQLTRESVLGILYTVPAGLVLLILDRTAKNAHEIENVLFGNAVFVSTPQLLFFVLISFIVLFFHGLFYKQFVFTAFDADTAQAAGLKTRGFNQLFFLTLAIAISVSISSIGALPVFSFMILPAASALLISHRLHTAFVMAVLFGICSALAGFYLSFLLSLPTGPAMLVTAALFLIPGLLLRVLSSGS
jgi:zinc transport system permease protein